MCVFFKIRVNLSRKKRNITESKMRENPCGIYYRVKSGELRAIDDIHRFSDVGKFISYCRLVKCSHESAGKKEKVGSDG